MSEFWNSNFGSWAMPLARSGELPQGSGPLSLRVDILRGNVRVVLDPTVENICWRLYGTEQGASRVQVFLTDGMLHVDGNTGHSGMGGRIWRSFTTEDRVDAELILPVAPAGATLSIGVGSLFITDATGTGQSIGKISATIGKGNIEIDSCLGRPEALHQLKSGVGTIRITRAANLVAETGVGDLHIGSLSGSNFFKLGTGNVLVQRVEGGSLQANAGMGDIRVKVPRGVFAYLNCSSGLGEVRSDLGNATQPGVEAPQVSLTARTGVGAIKIRYAED